jgi:hypothetical protein
MAGVRGPPRVPSGGKGACTLALRSGGANLKATSGLTQNLVDLQIPGQPCDLYLAAVHYNSAGEPLGAGGGPRAAVVDGALVEREGVRA